LTVIVPFPLPLGVVTVAHAWSLTTLQLVFEVTANEVVPAGVAGTFWLGGVTVSVGGMPPWETVTVTGGIPATVVVILATLTTPALTE
jgi:hypothetical protein